MTSAFKFIRKVDLAPMLYELSVNSGLWLSEDQSRSKLPEHIDTLSLILRHPDMRDSKGRTARHVEATIDSKIAHLFPFTMKWLNEFAEEQGAELARAIFASLKPGGSVKAHYDAGDYYLTRDRYHLVVDVDEKGSRVRCGEEEITWHKGDLFWFDNKRVHESFNDGGTYRVHLIFDMKPGNKPAIRSKPKETTEFNFERHTILEVPNAASHKECLEIIDTISNDHVWEATVGADHERKLDTEIRKASVVASKDPALIRKMFERLIRQYVQPHFGVIISAYSFPQFLKYTTDGKYEPHVDGHTRLDGKDLKFHDRDITVLLYLNEDFTGGTLGLPNHARVVHPREGSLVSFPAGPHFLHSANPVKSGYRYALVSWMTCLGSTREYPLSHDAVILIEDDYKVRL